MNVRRICRTGLATFIASSPLLAQAHPGHGGHATLADGLAHPFTGLDHLLVMIAIGAWSAQQAGSLRWAIPTSFVSLMIVGTVLGADFPAPGLIEQAIATTVLLCGLFLTSSLRVPVLPGLLVTGLFAVVHGVAHGMEVPEGHAGAYRLGIAAATAVLLAAGYAVGFLCAKRDAGKVALRWIGGVVTLCGLALSVG